MKNDQKAEYGSRESILLLMSDDEVASVSNAETKFKLEHGDEYVDLNALSRGVQRVDGLMVPMNHLVPKSCVRAETWKKILAELSPVA